MGYLTVEAENGTFGLSPAFSYRGIHGDTPDGHINFPSINQQALQMDAFAQCILQDKQTIVPGEMGMRDVYVMKKIYESADSAKTVMLKDIPQELFKI